MCGSPWPRGTWWLPRSPRAQLAPLIAAFCSPRGRYQQVFTLVAIAAVTMCLAAHVFQEARHTGATVVAIVLAAAASACLALVTVPGMVLYVTLVCVSCVCVWLWLWLWRS